MLNCKSFGQQMLECVVGSSNRWLYGALCKSRTISTPLFLHKTLYIAKHYVVAVRRISESTLANIVVVY